jgi:hypothetical protein
MLRHSFKLLKCNDQFKQGTNFSCFPKLLFLIFHPTIWQENKSITTARYRQLKVSRYRRCRLPRLCWVIFTLVNGTLNHMDQKGKVKYMIQISVPDTARLPHMIIEVLLFLNTNISHYKRVYQLFKGFTTLLSAHNDCHFFRVYFDCGADFQYSSSSIFNRLNINF